jgi:WD40 repeat protein
MPASSRSGFAAASTDLYRDPRLAATLRSHTGCVNTVNFGNSDSDLLVSGGDDTRLCLWRASECWQRASDSDGRDPDAVDARANVSTTSGAVPPLIIYIFLIS